jgi:hypothetical protein
MTSLPSRYHQHLFLLSQGPILKAPQITASPHWHFRHKHQAVQYLTSVLPSAINKYVIKSLNILWNRYSLFPTKPWRWSTTVFSKRLVVLQSCFFRENKIFQLPSLHMLTTHEWIWFLCIYLQKGKPYMKSCSTWFVSQTKSSHLTIPNGKLIFKFSKLDNNLMYSLPNSPTEAVKEYFMGTSKQDNRFTIFNAIHLHKQVFVWAW